MLISDKMKYQQAINNDSAEYAKGTTIATKTPVNAVAASVVFEASEIDVMNNEDTLFFDNVPFTKAGSTVAAEGEFADATGLAACINELMGDDWTATVDTDVTITSDHKGVHYNGKELSADILEATTAGGGESDKSTATVAGATITEMAANDILWFADSAFRKVSESPGDYEFSNLSELTALLDGIDGWDATDDGTDITITAAEDGDDNDGEKVEIALFRSTANGVDGTLGIDGEVCKDETYVYMATDRNPKGGANWERRAIADFATY